MEFVHVQKQAIGNALAQQVHAKQEAGSNSAKRDMRDELAKLKDMAQQLEVCTLVCIADGFVHSLSNRWPRVRCAAPAPHARVLSILAAIIPCFGHIPDLVLLVL